MKNKQDKLIHFDVDRERGISVTHGYNILNAFPVHFHTTFNLGIIEQGAREFIYRGAKTVVKQDDVFIIQPFEPHCCQPVQGSGHSYKIISLNLDNTFYFPHLIIRKPVLLNHLREFHTLAEHEKSSHRLNNLYGEIIHLLKMFSLSGSKKTLEIPSRILLAKAFITHNCHLEVSLKSMAEIACLSEFHFNRLFHKQFGLSPYAYYLVCKLKKSQKVLMEQKSVISTALDIGFFDQSHFTRLFKKHVGVTPGKYLTQNLP